MCEIDSCQCRGDRDTAFIWEDNSSIRRPGVIIAVLLAILAAFGYESWTSNQDMQISKHCYITAALGIFFSRMVGVGLMTLVFHSSPGG